MKKCLSIFLILTFLLNTSGYVFIYLKQQYDIKKEMLHQITRIIDLNSLDKISVSKSEFKEWQDENEINYKGKMYDIVKKQDKGNYIILYCINDKKEEDIIKSFSKLFDDLKKNDKSKRSLTLLTVNALINNSSDIRLHKAKTDSIIIQDNSYNSFIQKISPPPPRNTFI